MTRSQIIEEYQRISKVFRLYSRACGPQSSPDAPAAHPAHLARQRPGPAPDGVAAIIAGSGPRTPGAPQGSPASGRADWPARMRVAVLLPGPDASSVSLRSRHRPSVHACPECRA
ncbi:PREDICTED: uncharacterized protein LOC108538778 [Rhinopithecus bieti]|uniref:uncharacterized protein LOC108538778 n=1 Tax=Rhinopithecus bieti TaxID=61621 RepID=UPI00083C826F|nr:PREDICTED: uncharacterized protein LOC108538778 [Rhinopithecus bieti]